VQPGSLGRPWPQRFRRFRISHHSSSTTPIPPTISYFSGRFAAVTPHAQCLPIVAVPKFATIAHCGDVIYQCAQPTAHSACWFVPHLHFPGFFPFRRPVTKVLLHAFEWNLRPDPWVRPAVTLDVGHCLFFLPGPVPWPLRAPSMPPLRCAWLHRAVPFLPALPTSGWYV